MSKNDNTPPPTKFTDAQLQRVGGQNVSQGDLGNLSSRPSVGQQSSNAPPAKVNADQAGQERFTASQLQTAGAQQGPRSELQTPSSTPAMEGFQGDNTAKKSQAFDSNSPQNTQGNEPPKASAPSQTDAAINQAKESAPPAPPPSQSPSQ